MGLCHSVRVSSCLISMDEAQPKRMCRFVCVAWYIWVMSHTWMSHVTHMNEPLCSILQHTETHCNNTLWDTIVFFVYQGYFTYECVMPHLWMFVCHMRMRFVTLTPGNVRVCPSRCRVLQCVAVCCSVLQCAAVCCSVLPSVAVCCSMCPSRYWICYGVCCSALQCVAVCCSVLQFVLWMGKSNTRVPFASVGTHVLHDAHDAISS